MLCIQLVKLYSFAIIYLNGIDYYYIQSNRMSKALQVLIFVNLQISQIYITQINEYKF